MLAQHQFMDLPPLKTTFSPTTVSSPKGKLSTKSEAEKCSISG